MLLLLGVALLIGFPAAAVAAWNRRGPYGVGLLLLALNGAVAAAALWLASERGGNRLSATLGYGFVAGRTLRLLGLTVLLPAWLSAATVIGLAPRAPRGRVLAAGTVVYFLAVVTGIALSLV